MSWVWTHICHTRLAEVRGQSCMLVLSSTLFQTRSLLSDIALNQAASWLQNFQGFLCLYLPSPPRSAKITNGCPLVSTFYVDS